MPFDNPPDGRFSDADLLWAARGRIGHESGWVQGRYSDGDRLCLVAALSIVAGSDSFDSPNRTERRLARLLADQLPDSVPLWARLKLVTARRRLMWFNDSRHTKHQDVVALMTRTINRADSRIPVQVSASAF
jgi:hypothetical protein